MQTQKNTIESLPLHELYRIHDPLEREDWCLAQGLLGKHSWMWPQILAHYGRWQTQRSAGQLDLQQTLKHNIRTEWDLGLWTLVTKVGRGQLVKHQAHPNNVNWSTLVPVIPAALKRDQNIPYQAWPRQELHRVLQPQLWEVLLWADSPRGQACCNLGSDELIEIRNLGLLTKSGKAAGKPKNPLSTWALTGIQGTALADAPKLATTMLTQIWVAHPSLRTGYMILDPWNLDRIPESLWGDVLFEPEERAAPTTKSIDYNKLPWE